MKFWTEKEEVSCAEEAIEALADYLSSSEGIRNARGNNLDEVEQFAHKWGIPFSRSFVSKMVSFQDKKRWNGDGALLEKTDEELYQDFLEDQKENIEAEKENPDFDDDWLQDWFYDWKYENYGETHTWMSSSDRC